MKERNLSKALINNKDICDDFDFIADGLNTIPYEDVRGAMSPDYREFVFYVKHTVWKGVYHMNDNFLKLTCIHCAEECDKDCAVASLSMWTFEDDESIGLVHIISTEEDDCDIKVEFYWDMDIVKG